MTLIDLPPATYTLREASRLLDISDKHIYVMMHRGDVEVTRDVTGQLRITREELYRVKRERQG